MYFFSQRMLNIFPYIFQHIFSAGYFLAQYLIVSMFHALFKPLLLDNEVQIFGALVN